jgi:hypothetical protein
MRDEEEEKHPVTRTSLPAASNAAAGEINVIESAAFPPPGVTSPETGAPVPPLGV